MDAARFDHLTQLPGRAKALSEGGIGHRIGPLLLAVTVALALASPVGAAPDAHANCAASYATLGRGSDQHISYLATHAHPGEPDSVGRVAQICHYVPGSS